MPRSKLPRQHGEGWGGDPQSSRYMRIQVAVQLGVIVEAGSLAPTAAPPPSPAAATCATGRLGRSIEEALTVTDKMLDDWLAACRPPDGSAPTCRWTLSPGPSNKVPGACTPYVKERFTHEQLSHQFRQHPRRHHRPVDTSSQENLQTSAINNIETTLGLTPQGLYATVGDAVAGKLDTTTSPTMNAALDMERLPD